VQAGECILLLVSEGPAGYAELESAALLKHAAGMAGAQPLWPDHIVAWIGHRNDVREFYRYVASGMLVDTIDVATRWSVVADLYDAALADLHAGLPRSRSPQLTPRIAMLRARTCTSSLQPSRRATLRALSGCSDRSDKPDARHPGARRGNFPSSRDRYGTSSLAAVRARLSVPTAVAH
jgi:hypothetical protein